jgi:hypothetical protein
MMKKMSGLHEAPNNDKINLMKASALMHKKKRFYDNAAVPLCPLNDLQRAFCV